MEAQPRGESSNEATTWTFDFGIIGELLVLLMVAAVFLSACGDGPQPTATERPTATPVSDSDSDGLLDPEELRLELTHSSAIPILTGWMMGRKSN